MKAQSQILLESTYVTHLHSHIASHCSHPSWWMHSPNFLKLGNVHEVVIQRHITRNMNTKCMHPIRYDRTQHWLRVHKKIANRRETQSLGYIAQITPWTTTTPFSWIIATLLCRAHCFFFKDTKIRQNPRTSRRNLKGKLATTHWSHPSTYQVNQLLSKSAFH